ncbi:uncharacterized protein LOC131264632 [Anopheles coustani]|uniref:uncharacterized protein LOC131264632 n=1 Tax=Anopheles coustani TaxID=139045 RepID=UPI002657B322|nr:uncharacterized protein LOC131264632 [Anopheles coustani]
MLLNQSQLLARQGGSKELPPFSGRPEEWAIFIASYESSTDMCGYTDEENMLRLQKALSGKALDAVRSRLLHPANLKSVIETLRMLFGRPEIIIHQIMQRIRRMPAPRLENMDTLVNFGVAVQDMCATIDAAGVHEYLCDATLLYELAEKLPDTLRLDWARHRLVLKWVTLTEFSTWLNELVHAASLISLPSISFPKTERRDYEPRKEKSRHYLNTHRMEDQRATSPPPNATCVLCSSSCNGLATCKQFLDLPPQERWNTIRQLGLCRKCLTVHETKCHVTQPCGKNGCGYFHNPLLHDDARYRDPRRPALESIHTHSVSTALSNVLLKYVPITVYGRKKAVHTFAFLDSGSTGTFIEKSLFDVLDLEGTPHPLTLKWTGNITKEEKDSQMLSLKIAAADGAKIYDIAKAHTLQRLSLPAQSVCASDLASRYGHLKDIPLPSYKDARPQIIIGVDNERLAQPQRYATGGELEPIAAQTSLGWIVYGNHVGGSATRGSGEGSHSYVICANSIRDNDEMGASWTVDNGRMSEDKQQDPSKQGDQSQQQHFLRPDHSGQGIQPQQQPQQLEQEFDQRTQCRKRHRRPAVQRRQRQWRQGRRLVEQLRQLQGLQRERVKHQRQLANQQLLTAKSQCEQTPNANSGVGWSTTAANRKDKCDIRWLLSFLVLFSIILGWWCQLEGWTNERRIVNYDLHMRLVVVDEIDMRWRARTKEMVRDVTRYKVQLTRVDVAWKGQPHIFNDKLSGPCIGNNVGVSACSKTLVSVRREPYGSWKGKDTGSIQIQYSWPNLDWSDSEPGATYFKSVQCQLIESGDTKSSAVSGKCLERLIISAKMFPIAVTNVTTLISLHFLVGTANGNLLSVGHHKPAGLINIPTGSC